MRNKIIGNAAAVLNALGGDCITRAELEKRLAGKGVELTPDSLSNILSDLQELMWIERRGEGFRIGLGLAYYWTRARDRERMEINAIVGRVRLLMADNSNSSPEVAREQTRILEALMESQGIGKGKIR